MKRLKPATYLVLAVLLCIASCCSNTVSAQGIYQNWGLAKDGGSDNLGVIFSTDSNGSSLTGRYSFSYLNNGMIPEGAMKALNNKLYGIATNSPSSIAYGGKIIFEYDPVSGAYKNKVVISTYDVQYPYDNYVADGLTVYNGYLYGTTENGGSFDKGILYKYEPVSGVFTKLFDFDGNQGAQPIAELAVYNNKLYGVTYRGGTGDKGVLFEYDPGAAIFTKKIDINAGTPPAGSLTVYNNKLYGVAGGIFEYDPGANAFTNRLAFTAGQLSNGGLVVYDNKLWGLASGFIFQYDPATHIYTKKIDFNQGKTLYSRGNLAVSGNKLMAITNDEGSNSNNNGVLLEYDPATNTYTNKFDFSGWGGDESSNGINTLVSYNNMVYGTTDGGGIAGKGVIFKYDPATGYCSKTVDFGNSNGRWPSGSFTYFNNSLYGVTLKGGSSDSGTLFRYDINTKTATTEINFGFATGGAWPMGDLTAYNGKFYAMTMLGGLNGAGVLFSYDPVSKVYSKMYDLDSVNGGNINSNDYRHYNSNPLLLFNNKLYGTTHYGGTHDAGVIFEFDPATNVYTKKIDFDPPTGREPSGILTPVNGKLYGLTGEGGTEDHGVLFEYDPATNTYTKKMDFGYYNAIGRFTDIVSSSGLAAYNNKLYAVSYNSGQHGDGFLFQYDLTTGVYTKIRDFDCSDMQGCGPSTRLLLRNNLFYGMTYSGNGTDNYAGVIFEFNPVTNAYTKKADFDDTNAGTSLVETILVPVPAAIAGGNIGTCTAMSSMAINNSNNSGWKSITDQSGNAVAEINPNGNNLGAITTSLYVQNNPARIAGGLNYLNRSLTITVQNQPAPGQPVDVRLYITQRELDDLINTPGSGIHSINDLLVYKSEAACSSTIGNSVVQLSTVASPWGANYVLTTQVNSFSTFYFAATNVSLPVTLLHFTAQRKNQNQNLLNWETTAESNSSYFAVERATDGIHFSVTGTIPAAGLSSINKQYQFTDQFTASGDYFYRLKMVDKDGKFSYSKIVKLAGSASSAPVVSPNPVQNILTVKNAGSFSYLQIIDANGKTVLQMAGTSANNYNVSDLRPGLYTVRIISNEQVNQARFIKQ